MNPDLHIRFATLDDLATIVQIYNQAIRSKTATGDLDEYQITDRMEWFHAHTQDRYPIYVVCKHKKVIGFASLSPYRAGRRAMDRIAEISYYLDYHYLKQGIGTILVQHVIKDAKRLGLSFVVAILLEVNAASIALLQKMKFEKWGHLPNVIDLDGTSCGHLIYGLDINKP